jgi:carbon storage regulator
MLVLTRKVGERIIIGGGITVVVAAVRGGRVTLAVEAPPDVPVDRAEIHARRQEFATPVPVIVVRS